MTNTAYMQKIEGGGRTGACLWWEGWGREGLTPPLENEKKEAIRGNFNLFHLCFTNEIRGGGDRYTIHAKWKRVGGQALVHGTLPLPPPLENEKKEAVRRDFNPFHICFTNEMKGVG